MLVSEIVDELSVLTLAQIRQMARRWELKLRGTLKAEILQNLAELLADPAHTIHAYHALADRAQEALRLISVRKVPAYLQVLTDALDKLEIATADYPAAKIIEDLTSTAFLIPTDHHRGAYQIPACIRKHLALEYHYPDSSQPVAKNITWGTTLWGRIQGLVHQLPGLKPQSTIHLSEVNWNADETKSFRLAATRYSYLSWLGVQRHLTILPKEELAQLSDQLSAPPESVDFACRQLHETGVLRIDGEQFVQGMVEWQEMQAASPEEAIGRFYRSWLDMSKWAEVLYLPDVQVCYQPYADAKQTDLLLADQRARNTLVSLLKRLKPLMWYSIEEWIRWVGAIMPDTFPKSTSATSYPKWILVPSELPSEEEIPWRDSDGRYIHSILTGPLHWLGIIDLSDAPADQQRMCISALGAKLLDMSVEDRASEVGGAHGISSDAFTVEVPAVTPLALTTQLAHFAEWVGSKDGQQFYRITPQTFGTFLDKRGTVQRALKTLGEVTQAEVPDSLRVPLEKWCANHQQIRLYEDVVVLEVADEYLFEELKRDEALADAVIYEFSPRSALIRREALQSVYARLKRKGYTPNLQAE